MFYAYPNYKTKKALKDALKAGREVRVVKVEPMAEDSYDGKVLIAGPHAPEPHRWYAHGVVQDGKLVKVQ